LVENYAVVESLRIRFHAGLNVLTGETGSGKSIVVDALGLLFGGRASADMLRSGAERARIGGIFDAPRRAAAVLDEAGIQADDGELLIEREILANGKSRAFVCNRPATASLLRELAAHLGDIHGQHDQQRLFDPDAQLQILDAFADNEGLVTQVAEAYGDWRASVREIEEIGKSEQERLRLLDLWTFQLKEIESARLQPAEDTALEAERRVLQNVGKLMENANIAYEALYDAPESAYAQLRIAMKRIDDLCRIDESLGSVAESLKTAHIAVNEAAGELRDYLGKIETDPDRLESVEERLATIDKLKRKYGGTVEEILAFLEDVGTRMETAELTSERRSALEKQRDDSALKYEAIARQLRERRRDAAIKLSKKVQSELKSLTMERTVFEVRMNDVQWSSQGSDAVQFLVSANVGEEPRPLEKVASGGELSRIALALKTCATGGGEARTLVFDEVDAGIGGVAAESVGRRLKGLAARNQVLCVTHLAQIAGFGDCHYVVQKHEHKGRTVATVEELQGEARTREIGRMLSGQRLTPEALRHAEQLIRMSSKD
jgi:DNA repair protein RecN (Recombination protein N)